MRKTIKPTNKYDSQGRQVLHLPGRPSIHLPRGVEIISPKPSFVGTVLKEVVSAFRNTTKIPVGNLIFDKTGTSHLILMFNSPRVIWWAIKNNHEGPQTVAGGFFRFSRDFKGTYLRESKAAALSIVRGKGLYGAVLKELRSTYKLPLVSDRQLSVANILAWVARATRDDRRGGYTINPPNRKLNQALIHLQGWINVG